MRWFETPNFNFIGKKKISYAFSGIMLVASLAVIFINGLQYGIDFKGGKEIVVEFQQPVDVVDIRSELTEPMGTAPEAKLFGSDREVLIRTDHEGEMQEVQDIIANTFQEIYPDNPATIIKTDVVGPRFAEDLKYGALQ